MADDSDGYFAGRREPERDATQLSEIERDVLRYLSHGLTERMVADLRHVSRDTIKDTAARARRRLAAKNTTHAVAIALRQHVID